MEQSRLIKYIQELAPKERERFREFVLSPYFNQHKKTTELLEVVLDQLDKKSGKGLGKRSRLQKIVPERSLRRAEIAQRHVLPEEAVSSLFIPAILRKP